MKPILTPFYRGGYNPSYPIIYKAINVGVKQLHLYNWMMSLNFLYVFSGDFFFTDSIP